MSAWCHLARAIRRKGVKVACPLLCVNISHAVKSPDTAEDVSKKAVCDCIQAHSYDKTPNKTQANHHRLGRNALMEAMVQKLCGC